LRNGNIVCPLHIRNHGTGRAADNFWIPKAALLPNDIVLGGF
jgi:hypothetical protein